MRVLGIHDGHNASICLLEDGKIRFAIQEERLVNEKNKSGFPKNSIKRMLEFLNITKDEIDFIAVASLHNSSAFETGEFYDNNKSSLRKSAEHFAMKTTLYSLYKKKRRKQRLKQLLNVGFPRNKIIFVEHHLCHAATAYFGSLFPRDEKVLVLTNDGAGDGLCATVSIAQNNSLRRIASVKDNDSLAGVYCLITRMLGFKPLEHEYKLMGMAAYSSSKGYKEGYKIFKDLISLSRKNPLVFKRNTSKNIGEILPELYNRSKYQRFDNICAGLQRFTEEILVGWVKNCIVKTGINKVALAGGVFMNVKANQLIMELPEVKDIFIFPSCSDETISIGAAYHVYNQKKKKENQEIEPLSNFYLGDDFSDSQALEQIEKFSKEFNFSYKKVKSIEAEVAKLLADKQIVARFDGRMEFGARALGNRSILADPSDLSCLRKLNLMVKKRDFWMPFAPVILEERQQEYIINPKLVSANYMILTFNTTKNYGDLIAAVHQADLTARPQIINKRINQKYYSILKEFERITGRGALLNTSFNLHGLPIVHGPKEALEVFRDSDLKYLALGNYLINK